MLRLLAQRLRLPLRGAVRPEQTLLVRAVLLEPGNMATQEATEQVAAEREVIFMVAAVVAPVDLSAWERVAAQGIPYMAGPGEPGTGEMLRVVRQDFLCIRLTEEMAASTTVLLLDQV
jgi:hypothetical protein